MSGIRVAPDVWERLRADVGVVAVRDFSGLLGTPIEVDDALPPGIVEIPQPVQLPPIDEVRSKLTKLIASADHAALLRGGHAILVHPDTLRDIEASE